MAERVRASHVVATDDTIMPMLNTGKTANARMWVYVGDQAHPYNVFNFTLDRGRDGPKYFLKDYDQVLLADAYGGYNGVVAGNVSVRFSPCRQMTCCDRRWPCERDNWSWDERPGEACSSHG